MAVAFALASCAQVSFPDRADQEQAQKTMPTFTDVASTRGYIDAAIKKLSNAKSTVEGISNGADVAIAGGGLVALLGGVLRWSTRSTIEGLVTAGAGVGLTQTTSIGVQIAVLDNGLAALFCVRGATENGIAKFEALDTALAPVRAANQALKAEIANAGKVKSKIVDTAAQAQLQGKINDAVDDVSVTSRFLAQSTVPFDSMGQAARNAVDTVLLATNTQLDSLRPDGAAILKSVQSISTTAPSAGLSSAPANPNVVPGAPAASRTTPNKIYLNVSSWISFGQTPTQQGQKDRVTAADEINALQDAVDSLDQNKLYFNAVKATLPDTTGVQVSYAECSPDAIALKITPATNPISVPVNTDYFLTVSPIPNTVSWAGAAPPGSVPPQITSVSTSSITWTIKGLSASTGMSTYSIAVSASTALSTIGYSVK